MMRRVVVGTLALALGACAAPWEVTRVMDGRVEPGRFIEPDAYAAFLRGALAEESGRVGDALAAYSEAADRDADDPEIWSRIGAARCALTPRDSRADEAFQRALAIDRAYAPALLARARCRAARGDDDGARDDARRANEADPLAVAVEPPRPAPGRPDAERDRLVALTLLHGTSPVAWGALAAWGEAHGDSMLVARALAQVARLAPGRKAELAARAVALAGDGELPAARALAAALLDERGDRTSGGLGRAPAAVPLLARLAIDEALGRGDAGAARRRAVRAHVGLEVLAGRAMLVGAVEIAREIAASVLAADPGDVGARMVSAAAAYRLRDARELDDALEARGLVFQPGRASPEAMLAFARVVERAASPEAARRVVAAFPSVTIPSGDATVTAAAVDLAVRGVLRDDDLPLDARVELAARRSEAMPAFDARSGEIDARHRLIAFALEAPLSSATLDLARRLAPASAHDPLVAVALARLSLARGAAFGAGALEPILAADPSDPLLAAAALDLAKRSGDASAIGPARARLTAVARTAGERARALE